MASQPPLLLHDNVFDRINQYPTAVLSSAATAPGRDIKYLADYRRERTYYQLAAAGANVGPIVDLGAGVTRAVDSVFIDRGHNLWGKTLYFDGSVDGINWNNPGVINGRVVPVLDAGQFVPGGDPTLGWSVTEEGAIYALGVNAVAREYWRLYVVEATQTLITGIIAGARTQLDSYSRVLDEDAGYRKRQSDESEAGYVAASRVYPGRLLPLELGVIGATEYDGKVRLLRRAIFERDIPVFIAMNYGRWPERAWLYKLDADRWNFPTNGVHRAGTIPFRELYPIIR